MENEINFAAWICCSICAAGEGVEGREAVGRESGPTVVQLNEFRLEIS